MPVQIGAVVVSWVFIAFLMVFYQSQSMADESKIIPVVCPDAIERYHFKKALFRIKLNGQEYTRIGEFRVYNNPLHIMLFIEPALDGQPNSQEYIHLSQEAVDSIRPTQSEAEYEFLVAEPLGKCLFRTG